MRVSLRSLFLLNLLFIALAVPASAGDAGFESPFLTGAGARALGMGGGFTAIAADASSIFYNPAGLASIDFSEISFMHMSLAEGTAYNFGAWVYPTTSAGGIGVGMMRVGTGDIVRRNNFEDLGTFGYSNFQILLGYGSNVTERLAFGLSAKVVNQSLDGWSDYGFGLDVASKLRLHRHILAGIILRDIVPAELKLKAVKESIPSSITAGLAFANLQIADGLAATLSCDLEKVETRDVRVHTGVEIAIDESYFLRGGYDRDNLAFGAGFRRDRFAIDYAYKVMGFIDDSHRFSFSYFLGSSLGQRRSRIEEKQARQSERILEEEKTKMFRFYSDKADHFYYRFRLDSALAYYQRALAFDENNKAIMGTIAAIEEALTYQSEQRKRISMHELELKTSIEKYYQQAQNFYIKQYYPAALDMLDLIFDIDPDNPEANQLRREIELARKAEIASNIKIAEKAEADKDYIRAIEAYTRVLELDPANQEIAQAKKRLGASLDLVQQLNKGIELFTNEKFDEATKHFRAVLAINPSDGVALEYIKKISERSKKAPTLEDIQRDKEIWQSYVDGLRFMRDKEYEKAIEAWNKVLQKYPTNMETLNNLEQARLRLKSEKEPDSN